MSLMFDDLFGNFVSLLIGAVLATSGGIIGNWIQVKFNEKREVTKIKELLRPEFERFHSDLIEEQKELKKSKQSIKQDLDAIYDMWLSIEDYFEEKGAIIMDSLVWDTIQSSGNLIKLTHDEITAIQAFYTTMNEYNDMIGDLEEEAKKKLQNNDGEDPSIMTVENWDDEEILEEYIGKVQEHIEYMLEQFQEIRELKLMDLK